MACSIVGGVVFVWHALRSKTPMLDLRMFSKATYRASMIGGSLMRSSISATPFLFPLLFQIGLGWSPVRSGFVMTAIMLGSILARFGGTLTIRAIGFRQGVTRHSSSDRHCDDDASDFPQQHASDIYRGNAGSRGILQGSAFRCRFCACVRGRGSCRGEQGIDIVNGHSADQSWFWNQPCRLHAISFCGRSGSVDGGRFYVVFRRARYRDLVVDTALPGAGSERRSKYERSRRFASQVNYAQLAMGQARRDSRQGAWML